MRNPISIFFSCLLLLPSVFVSKLYAQNRASFQYEALRISRQFKSGSARLQGIGGAGVALGADISAVALNPATAAQMQVAEMSFGAAMGAVGSDWEANGIETTDSKAKFFFPQFGLVVPSAKTGGKYSRGYAIAINFSRVADFQNKTESYIEKNTAPSLVTNFLNAANGRRWSEIDAQASNIQDLGALAYFAYLIGPATDSVSQNQYTTPLKATRYDSRENVNQRGAQYAWNFALAGDFNDVFYYGFGLNVLTHRFSETKIYEESYGSDAPTVIDFELTEKRLQRGIGINASGGFVFKPTHYLRVGASATSPTYLQINETYEAKLDVSYNDYRIVEFGQEVFLQNKRTNINKSRIGYRLTAPAKVAAGIALFAGSYGFLTADAEWTDFSLIRLQNPSFKSNFNSENKKISSEFTQALTLRIGAEARIKDIRVRVGYTNIPNYELKPDANWPSARTIYSFGFGLRKESRYWDLCASFYQHNDLVYAYQKGTFESVLQPVRTSVLDISYTCGFIF